MSFWIIMKKICLCQQKMNGKDVIMFLKFWKNYSIAFKQVVVDSDTKNGSVDTEKTVTTQFWLKINDVIREKCWAKYWSNPENVWPSLIVIWVNL